MHYEIKNFRVKRRGFHTYSSPAFTNGRI
jgi:hypothetical protein